jgi:hypothetical protein
MFINSEQLGTNWILIWPDIRRKTKECRFNKSVFLTLNQGCGSGLDPDSATLWIRIRFGSGFSDFVDPDPYWESGSGSRGKAIKKFQWKNEQNCLLKFCFSLDPDPDRIEQKCWIRIPIKSIRIHHPALNTGFFVVKITLPSLIRNERNHVVITKYWPAIRLFLGSGIRPDIQQSNLESGRMPYRYFILKRY